MESEGIALPAGPGLQSKLGVGKKRIYLTGFYPGLSFKKFLIMSACIAYLMENYESR